MHLENFIFIFKNKIFFINELIKLLNILNKYFCRGLCNICFLIIIIVFKCINDNSIALFYSGHSHYKSGDQLFPFEVK
ncbi:hypothetical protein OC709_00925 ['Planchonia careya' phytoplasma]|nr:hypothetical protein ['Planchonia careya' phytoplasma]MDO8030081.1 hypothetical protein ['Planchonia careya' phytoplasma]